MMLPDLTPGWRALSPTRHGGLTDEVVSVEPANANRIDQGKGYR
jgi:hypothetical protein